MWLSRLRIERVCEERRNVRAEVFSFRARGSRRTSSGIQLLWFGGGTFISVSFLEFLLPMFQPSGALLRAHSGLQVLAVCSKRLQLGRLPCASPWSRGLDKRQHTLNAILTARVCTSLCPRRFHKKSHEDTFTHEPPTTCELGPDLTFNSAQGIAPLTVH